MADRPKTRHVVISYSTVKSQVGKVREMDTDDAAAMVAAGRARYASEEEIGQAKATEEKAEGSKPQLSADAHGADVAPGTGDDANAAGTKVTGGGGADTGGAGDAPAKAAPAKAAPAKATSTGRTSS